MTDFDYPRFHTLLADLIAPKGVKDAWAYQEVRTIMPDEELTRVGILDLAKITAEATRNVHEDGTECDSPLEVKYINEEGDEVPPRPDTPGGIGVNLVIAFSDHNETAAKALLDDVPHNEALVQTIFISMLQGYVAYCVHQNEHTHDAEDV